MNQRKHMLVSFSVAALIASAFGCAGPFGCSGAAEPVGDPPPQGKPRIVRLPVYEAPPKLGPQRSVERVVVAIDHSVSMAGFVDGRAIESVRAAQENWLLRRVEPDSTKFFSIGVQLNAIAAADMLRRTRFNGARADLSQALTHRELTSPDLAIVMTDGQPGSGAPGACTPIATETIARLASPLKKRIEEGYGVWMLMEQLNFDGLFFLNCRGAPSTMKSKLLRSGRRLRCGNECSYRYKGPRPLLTIVIAKPHAIGATTIFVNEYLGERRNAEAIRFHRPILDGYSTSQPRAMVSAPGKGQKHLAVTKSRTKLWMARVPCPTEKTFSVLEFPVQRGPGFSAHISDRLHSIVGFKEPELKLTGHMKRLKEPFNANALNRISPGDFYGCDEVWAIYEADMGRRKKRTNRHTYLSYEAGLICGCIPPSQTGTVGRIDLMGGYQIHADAVIDALSQRGFAADPSLWFDQPGKVYGLDILVQYMARHSKEKLGAHKTFVHSSVLVRTQ